MFRVTVDNKEYGVRFQYRPAILQGDIHDRHFQIMNLEDPSVEATIQTLCEIIELDDVPAKTSPVIARGRVTCDTRDKFDRNVGRFRAFRKAIDVMRMIMHGFDKPQRKLFFDAYFENHKHKRYIIERREAKKKQLADAELQG